MRFPLVSIERLYSFQKSVMQRFKALNWVKYIQKRYTFDGQPCDPKQTQKLQEHLAAKPKSNNNLLKLLITAPFSVFCFIAYAKLVEKPVPFDKDFKGANFIDLSSKKE